MVLKIYVDGSSLGNPGPAGVGVVACDEKGNIVATHKVPLNTATNNEAEYKAIIEALKLAQKLGASEVTLLSDSELVVQQLSGNYRVRSLALRRLHEEAMRLIRHFRHFKIAHIPREANKMANKLAQEASFAASSKVNQTRRRIKISPSILSADFRRLGEMVRELEAGGADWVHFDIIDGRFAPNITFGFPVIEALRSETSLPFDVHLMIVEPERYIERFVKAGANILTVHPEATYQLHRTIHTIKEAGAMAGVVLSPATPPEFVRPILHLLDLVLVMSVDPGFSGQKFLPFVLDKVRTIRAWIEDLGLETELEIDGGVTEENAAEVVAAGVTVIVSATGVFHSG
ncbi:MAG: ribulose-phosphate 3-epimerase, partial [Armatimonadota bacterium]|nr:ribulose-phosphate 3-epimerase [Armatimonadota bacterium]MDW8144508.1 ribulose-phosphate 3-epimerase [Armatimonadota bacterium]